MQFPQNSSSKHVSKCSLLIFLKYLIITWSSILVPLFWLRGLTENPSCKICGVAIEIGLHAVRDCARVRQVWCKLLPQGKGKWEDFFEDQSSNSWVDGNFQGRLRDNGYVQGGIPFLGRLLVPFGSGIMLLTMIPRKKFQRIHRQFRLLCLESRIGKMCLLEVC